MEFTPPTKDEELHAAVWRKKDAVVAAMATQGKHERYAAVGAVRETLLEELTGSIEDERERGKRVKAVKNAFHDLEGEVEREAILSGKRIDGRAHDEIRQITIEPNFIKRNHGSVLFTRGETQALVSCTLGTPDDEQIIDGIEEEYRKHFYLHYSFPPYSVGETRRIMGPGRREIGHGMLAERSLMPVLPSHDNFPYTLRIVSDIMESNGSSSMASVCGGCLSMMLAGVPLSQPVAGIAMGLVQEGDRTAILSDILGSEDHNGDMDFKVAGSGLGITALQMDIKIQGVTRELLENALNQAREGRIHILRKMLEVVPAPAAEISEYAPRMEVITIPSDRIAFLIGPGGRTIRGAPGPVQGEDRRRVRRGHRLGGRRRQRQRRRVHQDGSRRCARPPRSAPATRARSSRRRTSAPSSRSSRARKGCATSPSSPRATSTASRTW